MSDLKIVVAGASGRMGRTLIREIAQGHGMVLCGALEAEGHPNLGMDSGTLAGMQPNGMMLTADPFNAKEAVEWGLVNKLVSKDKMSAELADLTAKLRKASPKSRAEYKRGMNETFPALDPNIVGPAEDAVDGVIVNCYLALIYARVGEKDLAFPLLQRLIKTPGAVDSVDYSITVNDLKHRWEWDPIRSDPRFQKLLEQPVK